jgi:riboflavin synthase
MFTGIIEEVGRLRSLQKGEKSARMTLTAGTILGDVREGDSIAVNGVCLTVVSFGSESFTVDVSPESLRVTTLGDLRPGDPVNLERAMQAGGRFGGHIVSGHVDGVGTLVRRTSVGNATVMVFEAPQEVLEVSIPKGSIAVEGISLTLNEVGSKTFSVSIIPHTSRMTTLTHKKVGERVNLEGDLIGKYVHRFTTLREGGQASENKGLDQGFLAEHGFI